MLHLFSFCSFFETVLLYIYTVYLLSSIEQINIQSLLFCSVLHISSPRSLFTLYRNTSGLYISVLSPSCLLIPSSLSSAASTPPNVLLVSWLLVSYCPCCLLSCGLCCVLCRCPHCLLFPSMLTVVFSPDIPQPSNWHYTPSGCLLSGTQKWLLGVALKVPFVGCSGDPFNWCSKVCLLLSSILNCSTQAPLVCWAEILVFSLCSVQTFII